jgi:hypothetical protein
MNRGLRRVTVGVLCLILAAPLSAQDLDPRAYANIPVNSTFLVSGFAVSHGGVVNDPTLPDLDIDATVETPSLGVGHSFSLFGLTAQAFGALPYSWIQGSARGETRVTRAGVADMRIRLSVLVRGAPATSLSEFAKAPRRTILGTSLTVVAPTGEFFPDKLLNVGTNRWAFKPEIGVSQPIRQRWLLDMYAALWLFGANDSYFPGTTVVTQAPMGAFQVHLSYNFRPQLWTAFDATYYVGGRATRQGVPDLYMQSNSRVGGTIVLPVGRRHSVKLAASRGAIIRYGPDFSTFSFGWQTAWVQGGTPTVR